jgi:putative FmdB family regulatory protein
MPTYGYRCGSCGHEFEILQKMSDTPLTTCPKCSGRLAKIVYPAGIIYKGSGYYTTDYKGGKSGGSKVAANGAKSDSDSSSGSSGSSESSGSSGSDSKPAAESTSKSESKAPDSSSSD